MPRFQGIPVEQSASPRFQGVPVEDSQPKLPEINVDAYNQQKAERAIEQPAWMIEAQQRSGIEKLPELDGILAGEDPITVAKVSPALLTVSDPQEFANIVKTNFPNVGVVYPEPGADPVLVNNKTGVAAQINAKGLSKIDATRFAANVAAYAPTSYGLTGMALPTLGRLAARSAATEAGIQAVQAGSGGDFGVKDVAASAIAAPIAQVGVGLGARAYQGVANKLATPQPIKQAQTLGKIARGAALGDEKAQNALAQQMLPDADALKSSQALGVELPADVVSNNGQMMAVAGMARSKAGSDSASTWIQKSDEVSKAADAALKKLGANSDIASVSESVLDDLTTSVDALQAQSDRIYQSFDQYINPGMAVDMSSSKRLLRQTVKNLGGFGKMKAAEKDLLRLVNGTPTYESLRRVKADIGETLGNAMSKTQFSDVDKKTLSNLYAAVSKDQERALLNAVRENSDDFLEMFPGLEEDDLVLAAQEGFSLAKSLVAQRKAIEKKVTTTFGTEGSKSIATSIEGAIKGASDGNNTVLNKMLKLVPQDRHRETLMTGLMAATRKPSGEFSATRFSNLYSGLKNNKTAYATLRKTVGPQDMKLLESLNVVSRRMVDAENAVLKTGKANQAMVGAMQGNKLVNAVMNMFSRVTSVKAGPVGDAASEVMTFNRPEVNEELAKLFSSNEFNAAIKRIYAGGNPSTAVQPLARSQAFTKLANMMSLPKDANTRTNILLQAIREGEKELSSSQNP